MTAEQVSDWQWPAAGSTCVIDPAQIQLTTMTQIEVVLARFAA